LFNIIAPYIVGADVLDLFSGTGSIGIEALSRGANSAVFVDKSKECCTVIRENLNHTKLYDRAEVYMSSYSEAIARLALEGRKFDLIILDPPYKKNFIQNTLKNLIDNDIIMNGTILIAEHHIDDKLPEREGRLSLAYSRKYGDTMLSFYKYT
jgi:16S rRNA (guanine966-N2)-methyltransferase